MKQSATKPNPTIKKHPDVHQLSAEEGCAHILRGLISYHQRMTMGNCPERDFYLDALRFALACVEEKLAEHGNH